MKPNFIHWAAVPPFIVLLDHSVKGFVPPLPDSFFFKLEFPGHDLQAAVGEKLQRNAKGKRKGCP
jgi:hypothetical protein